MKKFIQKEKLGKRQKKQLDEKTRKTWAISPVTKIVPSKKVYSRKKVQKEVFKDFPFEPFIILVSFL